MRAIDKVMKEVLGDNLEKVIVSDGIVDSRSILTTSEYGWSADMKRAMQAQVLRDSSMSSFMVSKKITEVNPAHSIMMELQKKRVCRQTRQDCQGFDLTNAVRRSLHRRTMLSSSIDDEEDLGDDDDLPPLQEVE